MAVYKIPKNAFIRWTINAFGFNISINTLSYDGLFLVNRHTDQTVANSTVSYDGLLGAVYIIP